MEEYSGVNLWDTLPEDSKSMILSRLSNREAARIARVSKEFNGVVKNIRHSVQLLVLPPDLSPAALEGFVASNRNLKSLSFKRCSAKVKSFLPILEAAAGGKLDSKCYHQRSLESVDFRSCAFLTDVDVNALCVLHSRLEDVNLANCPGISDVALRVLSRYQQSRHDSGGTSSLGSATPFEKPLEETEESSMSVVQGPATIKEDLDTFWPDLTSLNAQFKVSSKVVTGDATWGASRTHSSPSVGLPHTLPVASDTTSIDVGQNSNITNPPPPSRSYAQAALKAIDSSPLMVPTKTLRSNVDVSSPLAIGVDSKSFVDANGKQVTLPHIDWTSVHIPARTIDPSTSSRDDTRLMFSRTPTPGEGVVVEEPNQDKLNLFSSRKKKGNKGKLADAKSSSTALPERMGTLQVDPAAKGGFLRRDDVRLATSRRLDKVVVDDDGKGKKYDSLDFESPGGRRLATRRSLHSSDSLASTSEASQESMPLPAGLEGLQVGTMMKHGRHKDIAPELLEYQTETPTFFGEGDEEHWKAKGLRSVSLAGCSGITDKGVQALLRGPSKDSLISLDISRCSEVTSAGLRLPPASALENLTAAQLPNIPRLFLQLSSEGSLRHLSLAACPKLDDLHLVAPYLQTLNVSNCKKLVRLQLKCPELLSCNLSLCESLETIGRFTCGSLQTVNVYGCRLLRPVGFSTILDSTVLLRELRCGGCDRLERLDILQASLVRLEAQGCSSLRRLNVQSRLLKSVDACGCKNLTEVYLFSPNLRRMLFSNCALLQTLVIPLDAMKQSIDLAAKNRDRDPNASQESLEISISGCNVPESVQKNLSWLCKHWKMIFAN